MGCLIGVDQQFKRFVLVMPQTMFRASWTNADSTVSPKAQPTAIQDDPYRQVPPGSCGSNVGDVTKSQATETRSDSLLIFRNLSATAAYL